MRQRTLGVSGDVVLELTTDANGSVTSSRIAVSSKVPELDAAVLKAAATWRYRPATNADGRPATATFRVPLSFTSPQQGVVDASRKELDQPCSAITTELDAFRRGHPGADLRNEPSFNGILVLVWATRQGPERLPAFIGSFPASRLQRVADLCAREPAMTFGDALAAGLGSSFPIRQHRFVPTR